MKLSYIGIFSALIFVVGLCSAPAFAIQNEAFNLEERAAQLKNDGILLKMAQNSPHFRDAEKLTVGGKNSAAVLYEIVAQEIEALKVSKGVSDVLKRFFGVENDPRDPFVAVAFENMAWGLFREVGAEAEMIAELKERKLEGLERTLHLVTTSFGIVCSLEDEKELELTKKGLAEALRAFSKAMLTQSKL